MNIMCPGCKGAIGMKNVPKAGKYTPKCPKCGITFIMTVPDDPDATIQVRAMPAESQKPSAPVPHSKPPASKPAPKPTPAVDATLPTDPGPSSGNVEATGDFTQAEAPAPKPRTPAVDRTAAVDVTGDFNNSPSGDPDATDAMAGASERLNNVDATAAQPYSDDGEPQTDGTTDFGDAKAAKTKKAPTKTNTNRKVPDQLGGYELVKELGAGGMGAVYLAKQVSLDRDVALKIMHANWASDPIFLARFTREAYAAAQLNHHNVVQIIDFGEDAGINFFSMEFVEGKSLGDVLKKHGKLEPNVAVGYVIQAARGLKYAHDRGMIHRDVKPDNLMLNVEGIVKVADLGLIKTREMTVGDDQAPTKSQAARGAQQGSKLASVSVDVTNVGTAMGSPSYMAPEQCQNASGVDARADVYSLGCTLFALLTGRTPFVAKTAVEMIRLQLNAPPPPLLSVAPDLPKDLCAIVDKTLSKLPEDRYQNMDELIAALKNWQDDQKAGPPRPTEEQISVFESLTKQLTATGNKTGPLLAFAVPIVGVLLGILCLYFSGMLGSALIFAAISAVPAALLGVTFFSESYLSQKAREWLFGVRILDWLTLVLGSLLLLVALYFTGLMIGAVLGLVLGSGAGLAYAFLMPKRLDAKRIALKGEFDKILKRLRISGMEEESVRQFTVDAAGTDWPSVYEVLFGYPAMAQLRAAKGEASTSLRDKFIQRLEAALDARKAARTKKQLQTLEYKRLEAEGVSPAEAKAQAEDAAEDLVEQATEIKASNRDKTKKVNVQKVMTRYEKTKLTEIRRPRSPLPLILLKKFFNLIFSPQLRVVLGALLIIGGVMWMQQNSGALDNVTKNVAGAGDANSVAQAKQKAVSIFNALTRAENQLKPLQVSFIPGSITSWIDSPNAILSGFLLIASAFINNTLGLLLFVLAAFVSFAGHKLGVPIPAVGPLRPWHLMFAIGLILGVLSFVLFGRRSS